MVMITFLLSSIFYHINLTRTDNGIIKNNRFHKLSDSAYQDTQTIILGDSSAGNALDEISYSKLAQAKTANLALTGSFGIVGTYNMLQSGYNSFPQLKNVIIMQTLDIWRRPYSEEGNLETLRDIDEKILNGYLAQLFNMNNIKFFLQQYQNSIDPPFIENDFLSQNTNTYANGMKKFETTWTIKDKIDPINLMYYKKIDDFCKIKSLKCIYIHGPLIKPLYENSVHEIQLIQTSLASSSQNIIFHSDIILLDTNQTGDATDHVEKTMKQTIGNQFFAIIRNDLRNDSK